MTTTDELALLAAICADPTDDTVRLAYADWLDENAGRVPCGRCTGSGIEVYYRDDGTPDGDMHCLQCCGVRTVPDTSRAARAEFIRVQVELANEPSVPRAVPTTPENEERRAKVQTLRRRAQELRQPYAPRWFALPGLAVAFVWDHSPQVRWCASDDHHEGIEIVAGDIARGFIDSLVLTAADWLALADTLTWSPGQTVECGRCHAEKRTREWNADNSVCRITDCRDCTSTGRVPRPCPPTAQPIVSVVVVDGVAGMGRLGLTPRNDGLVWFDNTNPPRWNGITFRLPTHSATGV